MSPFALLKVEDVIIPHPYCITPKHLQYADSMMLDEAALSRAEKRGATCDICKRLVRNGRQLEILTLQQHEKQKVLFIEVEDDQNLSKLPDLHSYLIKVKLVAEQLGIQAFAFPRKGNAS
jgi:hypothetical protein